MVRGAAALDRGDAATHPENQEWPFARFLCVCHVLMFLVRLRVVLVRSCSF